MATPTPVQGVSVQSGSSATSVTSPTFTSTTGNLLAVVWGDDGSVPFGASPISDNKANTWTNAVARAAVSGAAAALHYARNIAGGTGHTVTLTTTGSGFLSLAVEEISGADTTAPLDQHPAAATSAGRVNPHNATSITPTVVNTLAVAGILHGAPSNNTFAATGTAVVRTSQPGTTNMPIALSTDARAGVGAIVEGFNLSPDDSASDAVVVANFKGVSGAALAQALTVTSTTVPSIRRQVGKAVAAQSTTVVTLARQIGKAVAVQSATVASLSKQIGKAVAVQSTTLASLAKQVGKTLAAQSTTLVSLATRTGKGVTLTVQSVTAVSIATLKGRGVVLAVTSSTVATMARQVGKALAVQSATVTSITRQIGKVVLVTSTTLPTIRKGIGKAIAALSSTSVVMTALKAVAQAGTLLRFLVDSREPSTGLGTTRPASSTSSAEPSTTLASARPSISLTDTEPPTSVSTNVRGS